MWWYVCSGNRSSGSSRMGGGSTSKSQLSSSSSCTTSSIICFIHATKQHSAVIQLEEPPRSTYNIVPSVPWCSKQGNHTAFPLVGVRASSRGVQISKARLSLWKSAEAISSSCSRSASGIYNDIMTSLTLFRNTTQHQTHQTQVNAPDRARVIITPHRGVHWLFPCISYTAEACIYMYFFITMSSSTVRMSRGTLALQKKTRMMVVPSGDEDRMIFAWFV